MRLELPRLARTLLCSAGLLAALPAAASATTASVAGGTLTLNATSTASIYATMDGANVQISASSPDTLTIESGCAPMNGGTTYYSCAGVTQIVFNGSSSADSFLGLSLSAAVSVVANGNGGDDSISTGEGNDQVFGGPGKDTVAGYGGNDIVDGGEGDDSQIRGDKGDDTVTGGPGHDKSVQGNEGNDVVDGGTGNDSVYGDSGSGYYGDTDGVDQLAGGEGDDTLYPQGGSGDTATGGAGSDTVSYVGYQNNGESTFTASLDKAANDGPTGENDNVDPAGDVENLTSPDYSTESTLIGNDGPNVLISNAGLANVTITGNGGDDEIRAGNVGSSYKSTLSGGAGNDKLSAGDAKTFMDGGPGNDSLSGSYRDDDITGGPGADTYDARDGNDTVHAVDGEVDQVGCGVGADVAQVDATDVVNADPGSLCETTTVQTYTGPTAGPDKSGPTLTFPKLLAAKTDRAGKFQLGFTNPNGFVVTITAVVKGPAGTKAKQVTWAKATAKVAPKKRGKLAFKLSKSAKKLLGKRKKVVATATFTIKGKSGTRKVTKKVTLR